MSGSVRIHRTTETGVGHDAIRVGNFSETKITRIWTSEPHLASPFASNPVDIHKSIHSLKRHSKITPSTMFSTAQRGVRLQDSAKDSAKAGRRHTARVRARVVVMAMRKPSVLDLKENYRRGPLDGIGEYLSEAFAQIFSGKGEEAQVPWIEQPAFSGSISHHESGARGHGHSGMHSGVYTRGHGHKYAEGGLHDSMSENGSEHAGPLSWVTDSVGRSFFGANLNDQGQTTEPKKFYSTGYTGRVMSARRIRRDVDRLGRHY